MIAATFCIGRNPRQSIDWCSAGSPAGSCTFQELVDIMRIVGFNTNEGFRLGVVEGDEIPYRPAALAKKMENQKNWLTADPEIKCYLPGVPRATYMPYPFQIFQSASALFIAYEYDGAVRNIYLKDPGPAPVDSWMGQSVARWDKDTLVVDVTGLNDQSWFDRSGNFHSEAMHVVERYTRTSPDVISYEATIEDPNVFTRPWKISMPLYRRQEKNAQIMDFKCVEFVEELLYGEWRKQPLTR